MLRLGFRPTSRFALGLATFLVGAVGCTAGVQQTTPAGGTAGTSASGSAGAGGNSATGLGGFNVGGRGGSATGTGGTLPVPPGCGDGINNQGGIEACDDGNTVAGDGCNGICHVEPNWNCPSAGACSRRTACGDGMIGAGEVCDDRNMVDGDGCNATCTVQDPAYTCVPGSACIRSSICGNKRVEPGENCDDGNVTASDGCGASCQLEQGWVCPAPGSPCTRASRCGDGIVNVPLGEVCDDGNITEGDGCSSDCKIKGAGCSCIPGMQLHCPEVRCGNGTIEGTEKCDDGNAGSNDGCSSTCQVESGYVCPLIRAPCVPDCGDGILNGNEQCDPGITIQRMACSAQCRWNPGWACTGSPPTECHATRCGDGKKEGAEGCDDSNTTPFDGCSATCQNEPACPASSNGSCTGKCGDGLLLGGEACDDGNNLPGDGCSATCTVDSGFVCRQPPLGDSIEVPVVYRDFLIAAPRLRAGRYRPDATAITGLVADDAGRRGQADVRGHGQPGLHLQRRELHGLVPERQRHQPARPDTLKLCRNNGAAAYVNRWGANCEPWLVTTKIAYSAATSAARCSTPPANPIPCTSIASARPIATEMDALGRTRLSCTVVNGNYQAMYPDRPRSTARRRSSRSTATLSRPRERGPATIAPPYGDRELSRETGAPLHNFSFTSEVRYWFPFDSSKTLHAQVPGRRRRLGVHQRAPGRRPGRHPHGGRLQLAGATARSGRSPSTRPTASG